MTPPGGVLGDPEGSGPTGVGRMLISVGRWSQNLSRSHSNGESVEVPAEMAWNICNVWLAGASKTFRRSNNPGESGTGSAQKARKVCSLWSVSAAKMWSRNYFPATKVVGFPLTFKMDVGLKTTLKTSVKYSITIKDTAE